MPAELFLNCGLKTKLDSMLPDLGGKIFDEQSDQFNSFFIYLFARGKKTKNNLKCL